VRRRARGRRGVAAVYLLILLVGLLGLASLAVDYGHVQLVKAELERAADAGARAGALALATNKPTKFQADALSVVRQNLVDERTVPGGAVDIDNGHWDPIPRAFIKGGVPTDAVRVTVNRTATKGNPVSLLFAGVLGISACDVRGSAVVTGTPVPPTGFQGLEGITLKNNIFIGSYDSRTNTAPTEASAGDKAVFGSNGAIVVNNHVEVRGDVYLGPSGSISGSATVSGATTNLSSALRAPTTPAWNPQANPGGVPADYTVNSATRLPGGTYWFNSLTINGGLSFSGPATVIVNGDVNISADLTAYASVPGNLTVYQLGTGRAFGDGGVNNLDITAVLIGPGSDLSINNNGTFRGSAIFRTITAKNNLDLFYDEALGPAAGGPKVVQVQ